MLTPTSTGPLLTYVNGIKQEEHQKRTTIKSTKKKRKKKKKKKEEVKTWLKESVHILVLIREISIAALRSLSTGRLKKSKHGA